jgi:hypothetical protein
MLHVVSTPLDPLIYLAEADPVRPHIPLTARANHNSRMLVLMDDQNQIQSVLCVAFSDRVITTESDLFAYKGADPRVAMLYSIWSIARGGGAQMIPEARAWIRSVAPSIERMVTLSPQTEMARRFHLKQGARELQTNLDTVNYEYQLQ